MGRTIQFGVIIGSLVAKALGDYTRRSQMARATRGPQRPHLKEHVLRSSLLSEELVAVEI